MEPYRIELNDEEIHLVKRQATATAADSRQRGLIDHKMAQETGAEIDELGAGGEIAFCKFFRVPYEDLRYGSCRGWDVKLPGIGTFDVKTTRKPGNNISIAGRCEHKKDRADWIAGMARDGTSWAFYYYGMLESVHCFSDQYVKEGRFGVPYFSVPVNRLFLV
tara:strand:+ start:1778 stop:2266 length:489 start_codon:yes stop_codon:yes gene_type:complete